MHWWLLVSGKDHADTVIYNDVYQESVDMKKVFWVARQGRVALVCVLISLLIPGCGKDLSSETAQVFYFREQQEKGTAPYVSRMIVTGEFVRLDEGKASDDFLLYDRKKQVVISVTNDSESYYQFNRFDSYPDPTRKPAMKTVDNDAGNMPSVAGIQPVYKTYYADNIRCRDVVSLPGFKPDAVAAMKGLLSIMADQHRATLGSTPKEMQGSCMRANFIYSPVVFLDEGFPLREWDYRGYRRMLADFREESVDPGLFVVPESYERLTLPMAASVVPGKESQ